MASNPCAKRGACAPRAQHLETTVYVRVHSRFWPVAHYKLQPERWLGLKKEPVNA